MFSAGLHINFICMPGSLKESCIIKRDKNLFMINAFLAHGCKIFDADTPQGPSKHSASCSLLSVMFTDKTASVSGL